MGHLHTSVFNSNRRKPMKTKLAILFFAVTVFGLAQSSVFAQCGCVSNTSDQAFLAVKSYDMVWASTPCQRCLSNCNRSQHECAIECASVCPPPEKTYNLSAQSNFASVQSTSVECCTTGPSIPQQGCCTTPQPNRKRCFLGRFRN